MQNMHPTSPEAGALSLRYAKCIETSKRVRWDIERDVIRARRFDFTKKFLPDGLSRIGDLEFLAPADARFLSQIQGRTYANMLALVERFIGAKSIELGVQHRLGDQLALEALVRLTDDELKHQALFRRLDFLASLQMPPGYRFVSDSNETAELVLARSGWAVLALTLDIELVTLAHYRSSIDPDPDLCELWKDVFLFHWKEESQHAIVDELEWRREDSRVSDNQREQGIEELIALFGVLDTIVRRQAEADAGYFLRHVGRAPSVEEAAAVRDRILAAYRWQYIVSGIQEPRFGAVLKELTTPPQLQRLRAALAPVVAHTHQ
jgi:hypothetical protein